MNLDNNQITEIKGLENLNNLGGLGIVHNPIPRGLIRQLLSKMDFYDEYDDYLADPKPFIEYCRENKKL